MAYCPGPVRRHEKSAGVAPIHVRLAKLLARVAKRSQRYEAVDLPVKQKNVVMLVILYDFPF